MYRLNLQLSHSLTTVVFSLCFRLLGVWQLVYNITQQYAEELQRFKGCDGWEEEDQMLSVIMSQIQTALQATGQSLEEGHSLLSYSGLKQKTVTNCYWVFMCYKKRRRYKICIISSLVFQIEVDSKIYFQARF